MRTIEVPVDSDSPEPGVFLQEIVDTLDPREIVGRIRETFALACIGAAGMGLAVTSIHLFKGHGAEAATWAGTAQLSYTLGMSGVLVPLYEVHAGFFKGRKGIPSALMPVAVPFGVNVAMNAGTHMAAGTPELVASVAAASSASLVALGGLHVVRRLEDSMEKHFQEIRLNF